MINLNGNRAHPLISVNYFGASLITAGTLVATLVPGESFKLDIGCFHGSCSCYWGCLASWWWAAILHRPVYCSPMSILGISFDCWTVNWRLIPCNSNDIFADCVRIPVRWHCLARDAGFAIYCGKWIRTRWLGTGDGIFQRNQNRARGWNSERYGDVSRRLVLVKTRRTDYHVKGWPSWGLPFWRSARRRNGIITFQSDQNDINQVIHCEISLGVLQFITT